MKNKLIFGLIAVILLAGGWFFFLRDKRSAFMKCYESTGWVQLGDTTQPTCKGAVATPEDVEKIYASN